MSEWAAGYSSETDYVSTFVRELVPDLLDFVCLRNRVAPPAAELAAYCDLGAGDGFTAALVASASPRLQVTAVDVMPSHVVAARHLARRADLHNLDAEEQSFATAASGLPTYDYVVVHGVWAWVSAEVRADIVRFLSNRVKPGGVVYLGYSAMPGAAAGLPAHRLLRRLYAIARGSPETRVTDAVAIARELAQRGAEAFRPGSAGLAWLEALAAKTPAYLVHEVGARTWEPSYHDEVAAALGAAKLAYVGSADILDDLDGLVLTEPQRELLQAVPEPALRAVIKDTILDTTFRKDVFVRGARRLDAREWAERLLEVVFVPALPANRIPREAVWRGRRIGIDPDTYARVIGGLAAGPQRLGDLLRAPEFEGIGLGRLLEHATVLVACGGAVPLVRPRDADEFGEAIAAARRLNAVLVERAADGTAVPALAAPLLGAGIATDRLRQLFVRASLAGDDLARAATEALQRRPDGAGPPDPAAIAREAEEFTTVLRPFLSTLAIL